MRKAIKNIFKIFICDLKKICTNWVSLVVLGGLILLPSLYAWVNIYASWDPYGNTQGIKVAVVNEDQGGNLKDTTIDIGSEVMTSLKENTKLGWVFCDSREEGLESVNNGDVYATIIIPSDFSKKMLTLLDESPENPELEYYVNEKINAIAPKITDKGASSIQTEITTSFIETVADELISILYDAGVELDTQYPELQNAYNAVNNVDKKIPKLTELVDDLIEKAENGKVILGEQDEKIVMLQDLLTSLMSFNKDIEGLMTDLAESTETHIPELKENVRLTQTIFSDISSGTSSLENTLKINKADFIQDIESGIIKVDNIKNRIEELSQQASDLDEKIADTLSSKTDELISDLDYYKDLLEDLKLNINRPNATITILNKLSNTATKISNTLGEINKLVVNVGNKIDGALAKLQHVLEKLESLLQKPDDATLHEETLALVRTTQSELAGESDQLNDALDSLSQIESTLNTPTEELDVVALDTHTKGLSKVVAALRSVIDSKFTKTSEKITLVKEMVRELGGITQTISHVLDAFSDEGHHVITSLSSKITHLQETLEDITGDLINLSEEQTARINDKLATISGDLTKLQDKLASLSENLADSDKVSAILSNISTLTFNIQSSLQSLYDHLDDDLVSKLKDQLFDISGFVVHVNELLQIVHDDLDGLGSLADRLTNKGDLLVSDLEALKEKLPNLEERVHKLTTKLSSFSEEVDLKDLIKKATMDNSSKSSFLAAPVVLNTHVLFPMANYGAGMTPFYTTLCLWVGALLLTALLTTKAKNATFEYTPIQEYFGKYLLFATLAALQGFIAAMGDIFVLGVQMQEPVLFVMLAVFYSIIFSGIVYTLVSLFGNVGKSIGVVLLVLQLAGSGGTFPVQVTPHIFQVLNKFLPFTYGISGMREAVAGVVFNSLATDIVMLIAFLLVFLLIGVLLKQKANAFLHKFAHKLGESGVIEH